MRQSQKHTSYLAFLGHRLSGLALAVFLPFHFLVLGLALEQDNGLDDFLKWSNQPLVKIAEWGLVALLTIHLSFGLRLLVLEYLPWVGQRKNLVWFGAGFAGIAALVFLIRAF